MKTYLNKLLVLVTIFLLTVGVARADIYKVSSIAPGMSPFVVNTAIAKLVAKHVPGVEMQVKATGAATKHMVEAAKGKIDFLFGSPTINWLLVNHIGPFKSFTNGPELEENIGMIFAYQIGPYHYVVRADSGIETLEDIKGKKAFIGPPGGAATRVVAGAIKQATGLEGEKDYEVQKFGFDAAIQAFQDDKIDMIVLPTNVPSPAVEQFALTKEIRILDIPIEKIKIRNITGGTVNEIAPDAYGASQVNESPTMTHGAIVNFSARMDLDEDVVYQVTKAIWENLGELHETAKWMESTITKETGLSFIPNRLHPGAERYYKEMGWTIPEPTIYKPK